MAVLDDHHHNAKGKGRIFRCLRKEEPHPDPPLGEGVPLLWYFCSFVRSWPSLRKNSLISPLPFASLRTIGTADGIESRAFVESSLTKESTVLHTDLGTRCS